MATLARFFIIDTYKRMFYKTFKTRLEELYIMLGFFVNKGANEMADKFETNKHFRRWMWAVVILGFAFVILKYLPSLLFAINVLSK